MNEVLFTGADLIQIVLMLAACYACYVKGKVEGIEDKKYRIKDTDTKEFWMPVLVQKSFIEFVKNKYQVGSSDILKDEDIDAELAAIDDEE